VAGSFSGGGRDRKGGARLARELRQRARADVGRIRVAGHQVVPCLLSCDSRCRTMGGPLLKAGTETTTWWLVLLMRTARSSERVSLERARQLAKPLEQLRKTDNLPGPERRAEKGTHERASGARRVDFQLGFIQHAVQRVLLEDETRYCCSRYGGCCSLKYCS
jgi:hypothetical protein